MLWALPSVIGAGAGAIGGWKKGGLPGAIGGAVVGAIPWSKWKAAGMGLGFLKDWVTRDKSNRNNIAEAASYSPEPKASQFAQNYASNLVDQDWESGPFSDYRPSLTA